MKTKCFFMMLVVVLMGTELANAQQKDGKRPMRERFTMEQMAKIQAGRLVQELGLDDKTAAKFTEVYKKYMAEQNEVRKEFAPDFVMRGKVEVKKDGEAFNVKMNAPTDEQVDKMMRDRFKQSRKILEIREKYYDEFRKFLSPKQVQKIYDENQMEPDRFRQEMNRRAGIKNRMRNHDGGRPMPRP